MKGTLTTKQYVVIGLSSVAVLTGSVFYATRGTSDGRLMEAKESVQKLKTGYSLDEDSKVTADDILLAHKGDLISPQSSDFKIDNSFGNNDTAPQLNPNFNYSGAIVGQNNELAKENTKIEPISTTTHTYEDEFLDNGIVRYIKRDLDGKTFYIPSSMINDTDEDIKDRLLTAKTGTDIYLDATHGISNNSREVIVNQDLGSNQTSAISQSGSTDMYGNDNKKTYKRTHIPQKDSGRYKVINTHYELLAQPKTSTFGNTTPNKDNLKGLTFKEGDEELLARLINSEAGIEPYLGKLAVGANILNRMKVTGRSMEEVIFAPSQYSGTKTKWFKVEPKADSWRAAREVLSGVNVMPTSLFFADLRLCDPRWSKEKPFITRIGDHWFFE